MEFWALEQGEAVRIAKTAATLLAPGALVSTLIVREIVVKVPPH